MSTSEICVRFVIERNISKVTLKSSMNTLNMFVRRRWQCRLYMTDHTHQSICVRIMCSLCRLLLENCCRLKLVMHMLGYFILTLLLLPTSSAAVITPETLFSKSNVHSQPLSRNCYRQFGHKLELCIKPFESRIDLSTIKDSQLPDAINVHICLEYQLVLLCLHSALTACHSFSNLRRVQSTLETQQWVATVNRLCSIPSHVSSTLVANDNKDLTNYIDNQNLHQYVSQPPEFFINTLLQTSADDFQSDFLTSETEDEQSTSLASIRPKLESAQLKKYDLSVHPTSVGSQELHLNNFVNNYQYHKSDIQQKKERVRPSVFQVMFEKSSSCVVTASLCLIVLLLVTVALLECRI